MARCLIAWLRSIDPEQRVEAAAHLLIFSVVGWPVSALTVFRHEQQGILGLSWAAIILTCVDIIVTSDVRQTQEEEAT